MFGFGHTLMCLNCSWSGEMACGVQVEQTVGLLFADEMDNCTGSVDQWMDG